MRAAHAHFQARLDAEITAAAGPRLSLRDKHRGVEEALWPRQGPQGYVPQSASDVLGSGELYECRPGGVIETQRRPGLVLRVTDVHDPSVGRDLDALAS